MLRLIPIRRMLLAALVLAFALPAIGQVYNVKIVTDASPDYSDMPSMVHSITSNWQDPKDKCWAMFYWMHLARRQTTPMHLHGMDLTDPILQFNDYGYTMCSTISGINCGIWNAMGLASRYWDISHHTVSEVQYDGKWHLYDDSLSAVYTLCDGRTIAGVEDIGAEGACAASGGKKEKGHVALYHCLHATSPCGFLQGADVGRDLGQEVASFAPGSLKRRDYHDWNWGHRYILNVQPGSTYTRYYRRLDKTSANDDYFNVEGYRSDPKYFVPNPNILRGAPKGTDPATQPSSVQARIAGDPEIANPRYYIRGNGTWTIALPTGADFKDKVHAAENVKFEEGKGLIRADNKLQAGAFVIFRVNAANVMTHMQIQASSNERLPVLSVSTDGGANWHELPASITGGKTTIFELPLEQSLKVINGHHAMLIKAQLGEGESLANATVEVITQINSKTQPKLNIGRNEVFVSAGDQTDSIVVWPDLESESAKPFVQELSNVRAFKAVQYQAAVALVKGGEGHIQFKVDAPRDITRIVYGAKMALREKGGRIDFLHSFDNGKTWNKSYSQDESAPDPIHYVTVDKVPEGVKSVLFRYLLAGKSTSGGQLGIEMVRMEVNHKAPASWTRPGTSVQETGTKSADGVKPISIPNLRDSVLYVKFAWKERQKDYSLVDRSHTERISSLPHRYVINVGGEDHPAMESLTVEQRPLPEPGFGDMIGVSGPVPAVPATKAAVQKWQPRTVKYGNILSLGKKYTVSAPSLDWRGGKDDGVRMTDGVIGPLYAGGNIPKWGMVWQQGADPVITVDIEKPQACGAFRFHMATWPWWDALKGQMKDKMEVLTSLDGKDFASQGFFDLSLRLKDIPINHMLPDEETAMGWVFEKILEKPVTARYVQFKLTIADVEGKAKDERKAVITEVQALDAIHYEPFDLKLAVPK